MALQFVPQPTSQTVPSSRAAAAHSTARAMHDAYLVKHRLSFAAVLAQIPAAVEARRRARNAKPPTPPTVFILDWDDTCCATSSLEQAGFMADLDSRIDEFAPEQARQLRVLENRVLSLLKMGVELGTVLIVTNAGDGWVELSSSRFLPAVRAFLDANYKRIKVISARARYVDVYRENPLQWKVLTFADEIRLVYQAMGNVTQPLHAIVLGDSVGDQYAAHVASGVLEQAGLPVVLKVVKFMERPTIDQLCKELGVLLDHLVAMTAHSGPFDISIQRENSPSHHSHYVGQQHQQQQQVQMAAQDGLSSQALPTSTLQSSTQQLTNSSVESQHGAIAAMATCSAAV